MKYLFFIFAFTGLLPSWVLASENAASKYEHCMTLVENDDAAAVKYADEWIFSGISGGVPAGHCKALGLLSLGQAKEAARLLEKLVDDMLIAGDHDSLSAIKNADLRVQLHGQAALAWKEAGDFDKSYVAYSSALSGIREDVLHLKKGLFHELYLARGTLQILRGQYKAAVKDFTLALDKDAGQFEGFLQRAKAYRKRRSYLKARLDLRLASKLALGHPAILLESGILYRELGQKLEARREWQKIVDHNPKSDYAEMARTNIALLKPQL